MRLRDNFWLWGHPEGCYNNAYGNHKESRMTPMEACLYLGIRNAFMVPDGEHTGVEVNHRQYYKSFSTLRGCGWECFGADKNPQKIEQLIQEAAEFPNVKTAVFDDFVLQAKRRQEAGEQVDAGKLWQIRERLHNNEVRPLDMWMVLYTQEFGLDAAEDAYNQKYLDPFDGIIMWTWKESDVPLIPEKYEIFKKMTPNNRRMFGCYLWNFGECKEATGKAVQWQLDWYREKIMAGEAEGVVLHTNTMADLDYEAYDAAIEWMNAHGDEEIPDFSK